MIDRFEGLLASGRDDPMIRLSLGQAYLAAGGLADAERHLRAAIDQKPDYTAAFKFLGKVLEAAGDSAAAARTYEEGIEVAGRTGDRQLEKEMRVFLRRLDRKT